MNNIYSNLNRYPDPPKTLSVWTLDFLLFMSCIDSKNSEIKEKSWRTKTYMLIEKNRKGLVGNKDNMHNEI